MRIKVLRGEPDDVIGLSGVRNAADLPEKLVMERFGQSHFSPDNPRSPAESSAAVFDDAESARISAGISEPNTASSARAAHFSSLVTGISLTLKVFPASRPLSMAMSFSLSMTDSTVYSGLAVHWSKVMTKALACKVCAAMGLDCTEVRPPRFPVSFRLMPGMENSALQSITSLAVS